MSISEKERADRHSITSIRLQMLILVFGRKVSEDSLSELKRIYSEALERFHKNTIAAAFSKAEQEFDKFPTPKQMVQLCAAISEGQGWKYDFEVQVVEDPETGDKVKVLFDPDPTCRKCRAPKSEHPVKIQTKKGPHTVCKEFVGDKDDAIMFRPQNCPEGREFLKVLRQIAGRQ